MKGPEEEKNKKGGLKGPLWQGALCGACTAESGVYSDMEERGGERSRERKGAEHGEYVGIACYIKPVFPVLSRHLHLFHHNVKLPRGGRFM